MSDRNEKNKIPIQERIIVALDIDEPEKLMPIVSQLSPHCSFYKVGLELFLAGGWPVVEEIRRQGFKVMLDLKFHDIPRTTERAVRQLNDKGVSFVTVHAEAIEGAMAGKKDEDLKILAVTRLTSIAEAAETDDVQDAVLRAAESALKYGCDGLVASARDAAALRKQFGDDFILVTPGIRDHSVGDDQKRTATAKEATKAGADYLVVGRPIVEAEDPVAILQRMQNDIEEQHL